MTQMMTSIQGSASARAACLPNTDGLLAPFTHPADCRARDERPGRDPRRPRFTAIVNGARLASGRPSVRLSLGGSKLTRTRSSFSPAKDRAVKRQALVASVRDASTSTPGSSGCRGVRWPIKPPLRSPRKVADEGDHSDRHPGSCSDLHSAPGREKDSCGTELRKDR
jgi:hypothetical protein